MGSATTALRRRLRAGLYALLVLFVAGIAAPVRAESQDGDPLDTLRDKLASSAAKPEWKGLLGKITELPEAERETAYVRVLAPLLDDVDPVFLKQPIDRRENLRAYLAEVLLADPAKAGIEDLHAPLMTVLAEPKLRKIALGELPVDPDTKRAAGWDRALAIANGVLRTKVSHASRCLKVLLAEAGGSRAIDVLAALVKYRKEGGAKLGLPTPAEYLHAYKRILGHKFQDIATADKWIAGNLGTLLDTWKDFESWDADHQRARVEAAVRRTVKEHHITEPVMHNEEIQGFIELIRKGIEKIDKANALELAKFWETDPKNPGPWEAPLQEAAIKRAKALNLGPDAQGVGALTGLFPNVVHRPVLVAAMDLVNGWAVPEPTDLTRKLAKEMSQRLSKRNGADLIEHRIRLVRFISVFGGVENLGTVLELAGDQATDAVRKGHQDKDVRVRFYVETIAAMAQVKGTTVLELRGEYWRKGALGIEAARVAVVRGLSRQRIRENDEQRAQAAAFLRLVLEGGKDGDVDVPADPKGSVRIAAIRSLAKFPGPETVGVLSKLSESAKPDDAHSLKEANEAITSLVRHLDDHGSEAAGQALAAALRKAANDSAVERHILTALSQAGGDEISSKELADAVRAVFAADPPRPDEVRDLALRGVTLLADPASLDLLTVAYRQSCEARASLPDKSEDKDEQAKIDAAVSERMKREKPMIALATAIAKRDGKVVGGDRAVGRALRVMTEKGGQCERVMTLLEGLGDHAKRTAYRLEEAHARAQRMLIESRDTAARIADADAALEILRDIIDDMAEDQRREETRFRFLLRVLHRVKLVDEKDAKGRAEQYERALLVAVGAKDDKDLVQLALRTIPDIEQLYPKLDEDLRDRIVKLQKILEAAANE